MSTSVDHHIHRGAVIEHVRIDPRFNSEVIQISDEDDGGSVALYFQSNESLAALARVVEQARESMHAREIAEQFGEDGKPAA